MLAGFDQFAVNPNVGQSCRFIRYLNQMILTRGKRLFLEEISPVLWSLNKVNFLII